MRRPVYQFFIVFFFCSLASLFALSKFNYPLTGIDDANIYFVYARNLANGHGFVYNVGSERVEGFTSFLWTIVSACAFKFSAHPELILLIINILVLSTGITVTLQYLQHDFLGRDKSEQSRLLYSIIFLILLLTSPRYIVWNTITLMENGLWSTLLLVTTVFVIKDDLSPRAINRGFIPLVILLVLTRPESFLWGAVFLGVLFVRGASAKNNRAVLRDLAPSIACFAAAITLMILFQLQYFGYLLPNTYYAKVSPSFLYNVQQGIVYLYKYFLSDPIVLLSVSAVLISAIDTLSKVFSKQIPNDGSFFVPVLAGTGLLAPLITGGDHFGSFRLYQNIYPIQILCLLYFVDRVLPGFLKSVGQSTASQRKSTLLRLGSAFLLGLVFIPSQLQMWNSIQPELDIEFEVADYGRKNGAFIQKLCSPLPDLPSLGVVTSGGIKYSYEGEIIDLMGLNNTIMAHNHGDRRGIKNHAAFDIPTFYILQPDVLWPQTVIEKNWQYSESEIKKSWENREGLKGLFDQSHFLERYTYAKVSGQTDDGYALVAWFKKDFLRQLSANAEFRLEKYPYSP